MRKRLLAAVLAILIVFGLTSCEQVSPTNSEELSTDAELLLSFLNGETQAVVDEDFYNDLSDDYGDALDGGAQLSFADLTALVDTTYDVGEDLETSCALMETLGGREMLAVRYQWFYGTGFGIYFIFGVYDQEICLTYARDYRNRNYAELRQGLVLVGGASGGAGYFTDWRGYIDDTGHYRTAYQVEHLGGSWLTAYAPPVFEDGDWGVNYECYLCLLTTDEGEFYELDDGWGTYPEKLALMQEYLAQQGITEIDSVEEAIQQAKAHHGVEDAAIFEDWLPWEAEG